MNDAIENIHKLGAINFHKLDVINFQSALVQAWLVHAPMHWCRHGCCTHLCVGAGTAGARTWTLVDADATVQARLVRTLVSVDAGAASAVQLTSSCAPVYIEIIKKYVLKCLINRLKCSLNTTPITQSKCHLAPGQSITPRVVRAPSQSVFTNDATNQPIN